MECVVRVLHQEHTQWNRDERVNDIRDEVPDAVIGVLFVVQEEREDQVEEVGDDGRRNLLRNVQKEDMPFALRAFEMSLDWLANASAIQVKSPRRGAGSGLKIDSKCRSSFCL